MPHAHPQFSYDEAFSRNLGWVTEHEQQRLKNSRVCIAGLGGVGGVYLLTLARLGVGAFTIADFDTFALANFNRQAGASLSSLDRPKIDVMVEMARDINPDLDIRIFPEGLNDRNLGEFLADGDVYLDGLDFFALDIRRSLFSMCGDMGIPATTVAPLGMGAALLNFVPGGMTFEQYFGLAGHTESEQALRFLVGLSPAMLQMPYLVDRSRVDLEKRRGPSTIIAVQLCSGIAAAQVLKLLLGRGDVVTAPSGLHFDAFRNLLKRTWRPGGSKHPMQRLLLHIARRRLRSGSPGLPSALTPGAAPDAALGVEPAAARSIVEQILELGRWAPSGDNTQPWRFEVVDELHVVVHGFDTRDHCVYDLDGHPSQISLGALLETISIAASAHGLRVDASRRLDVPDTAPTFDLRFAKDPQARTDPLVTQITSRSVQRRMMRLRPLSVAEKQALEAAVGNAYDFRWLEGFEARSSAARLMFNNAKLRLTMPEAYRVHRDVIEWNARFSEDRVPDQALGADPMTTKLMRHVLGSWERVKFFNRFLAGTIAPRLQMDLIPGLFCAAHFVLLARRRPQTIDDYVAAGRALQRFWLTATSLGLVMQPELTPLIFSRYVRNDIPFSSEPGMAELARSLARQLEALIGTTGTELAVFMGRIGAGPAATSRSTRRRLDDLIVAPAAGPRV